jgi:gamma-glutamyl-gamma-aminobutyrate hydrolase PuuD
MEGVIMTKTKVYVEGENYLLAQMFIEEGFDIAQSPEEAHLICMEGGADVDPSFYGEKNTHSYSNIFKDYESLDLLNIALKQGTPVVGVCRGHQIMCVHQGGKMVQHIQGHTRGHMLTYEGTEYPVTSTHHQMAVPALSEANIVRSDDGVCEIVLYPNKKWLGFQPHPEFTRKGSECRELFFLLLEKQCGVKKC